jgi:hypothetical protein
VQCSDESSAATSQVQVWVCNTVTNKRVSINKRWDQADYTHRIQRQTLEVCAFKPSFERAFHCSRIAALPVHALAEQTGSVPFLSPELLGKRERIHFVLEVDMAHSPRAAQQGWWGQGRVLDVVVIPPTQKLGPGGCTDRGVNCVRKKRREGTRSGRVSAAREYL